MPAKTTSSKTRSQRKTKKVKKTKSKKPVTSKKPLKKSKESTPKHDITIKDEVIDKAVSELKKWNKRQIEKREKETGKQSLFDEDDEDSDMNLFMFVTNVKYFSKKSTLKPKCIKLDHSIHNIDSDDPEAMKICVFVKDNSIDEELLNKIEEAKIPHLAKIIEGRELKTTYKSFQARRKLLSEYDMFLSDDNLITALPKLLGKVFYQSSKFPVPIRVHTHNQPKISLVSLKNHIAKAIDSLYFIPPMGVNITLNLGNVNQKPSDLHENIHKIASFMDQYPIRMVQLKLEKSPALPVYIRHKLYTEADIDHGEQSKEKNEKEKSEGLSAFDEGLIELALDEDEEKKILESKQQAKKELKRKHETDAEVPEKKAKATATN